MKKFLFSSIAILFSIAVYSQTIIPGGPISGTWTVGGEPYLIEGETTIENGTTLTIEAGVHIIWQNDSSSMWVQGQILAEGTETDSIIFTAADPLTGWKGVRFDSTLVTNDSTLFEYCVFEYAKAYGPFPDNSGGAIAFLYFGKIRIDHCTFRYNEAIDNSIDLNPSGGAIVCYVCSPIILNSRFINNKSAAAAAINCAYGSHPRIQNNEFADNTAISYGYWGTGYGGAISIYLNSDPDIINNTFHDNYAQTGGGAISMVDKCDPLIKHNLIHNNICGWIGGGIEIQDTCNPIIINNTIAHNTAKYGGGIDLYGPNTPEIRNTILWGNTATIAGDQVYIKDDGGVPDFFYCDIEGGQDSIGGVPHTGEYKNCIDSIPLFVDHLTGDYHLMLGSPCIDAGDPASPLDPDGTISDMGALFFDQTGIGAADIRYQKSEIRIECFPNPTQGISDIRYQISEVRNVTLTVHDITGKQIMLLADETQNAGEHVVRIDITELPDGLYVIRLQAGNESAVGKVLVVR